VWALGLELLSQYEDHISAVLLFGHVVHPSNIGDMGAPQLLSGLHRASFFGIFELATTIINAESCQINQRDCSGRTPLAFVARFGHIRVAKLLQRREDIDPNRPGKHGCTQLSHAAWREHGGIVKLLRAQKSVGNADAQGPHAL